MKTGIYNWIYSKGSFQVEFRSFNQVFYCSSYAVGGSTWQFDGQRTLVDWKKYGCYEFELKSTEPVVYEGNLVGSKENWRRLEFLRSFTPEELLLQGENSAGTVWNFEYEHGSFEVQFLFDSYNHFICPTYPAHSHWKMIDGRAIEIDWGKYGTYDLEIITDEAKLIGSKKGQPFNWRRAQLIRALTAEDLESAHHEHSHSH